MILEEEILATDWVAVPLKGYGASKSYTAEGYFKITKASVYSISGSYNISSTITLSDNKLTLDLIASTKPTSSVNVMIIYFADKTGYSIMCPDVSGMIDNLNKGDHMLDEVFVNMNDSEYITSYGGLTREQMTDTLNYFTPLSGYEANLGVHLYIDEEENGECIKNYNTSAMLDGSNDEKIPFIIKGTLPTWLKIDSTDSNNNINISAGIWYKALYQCNDDGDQEYHLFRERLSTTSGNKPNLVDAIIIVGVTTGDISARAYSATNTDVLYSQLDPDVPDWNVPISNISSFSTIGYVPYCLGFTMWGAGGGGAQNGGGGGGGAVCSGIIDFWKFNKSYSETPLNYNFIGITLGKYGITSTTNGWAGGGSYLWVQPGQVQTRVNKGVGGGKGGVYLGSGGNGGEYYSNDTSGICAKYGIYIKSPTSDCNGISGTAQKSHTDAGGWHNTSDTSLCWPIFNTAGKNMVKGSAGGKAPSGANGGAGGGCIGKGGSSATGSKGGAGYHGGGGGGGANSNTGGTGGRGGIILFY